MLRKLGRLPLKLVKRSLHYSEAVAGSPSKSYTLELLKERDLIRVSGNEAFQFLQGLTTNDMRLLGPGGAAIKSIYSVFLNKGGRVLFDSIIYKTPEPNTYLIECDRTISNELRRLLRNYRVRRAIDIAPIDNEYKNWVVFNANEDGFDKAAIKDDEYLCALDDPRIPDLGLRIITPSDVDWSNLSHHISANYDMKVKAPSEKQTYVDHRYTFGVPEGVKDIPPGKCFPFETNCDLLNALSFNKGCYVGQELTARVFHTGVVRKRYMPITLTAQPEKSEILTSAGIKVGHVVGNNGKKGLALLRLEAVQKNTDFEIEGDPVYINTPKWWPRNVAEKLTNMI